MEISKSLIESYNLRDNGIFADITLDSNGSAGRVSIASSYGNWSNYWNACGCPFKEFLVHLRSDIHYAAGKFKVNMVINVPETLKRHRDDFGVALEQGDIEMEKHWKLLQELKEMEENPCLDRDYYQSIGPGFMEFYDSDPCPVKDMDPSFKAFWDKLWLPFLDHLEKEASA